MNEAKAIPQECLTTGEVAKKMGVTVRTLQYYDAEGLLSPTTASEGGDHGGCLSAVIMASGVVT